MSSADTDMRTGVHYRTCPLCECMCGLQIHVKDEQVTLIRPDRDDVWSRGFICPKGTTLGHLHHDPDRLRAPMVRDGDTWREVTWDEAFARCEELLLGVIERHGREAVTCYVGNPTAHNFSLGKYVALFIAQAQFPMIYSAGTVDQWPKNVSAVLMWGQMWWIPAPDIRRTDYFVVMGANPHASQGSFLACPDVLGEIDNIRARGGKTVVIDPRRTGTADRADEWIPIVPGTDAAFLLAVLQVLFEEGLIDLGDVADIVNGVEELPALCADFTPEAVEDTCNIPAATIRRIAREIAAAPAAAVYGRIGLCNQEFGTLASWLIDVVNIVTGNFDREGGMLFGNPIAWSLALLPNPAHANGVEFGRWRSRVRGAPEVLGQVPVSCLSEEISTPGDGQIKALITIAGNPVLSSPDAAKLDDALPELECMISVDNWLNETTRHAHVILPGLSALEQPHYDDLIWSWAANSAGNWSEPVFEVPEGRPREWEILTRLGAMCAGMENADIDVHAIDDGVLRRPVRDAGPRHRRRDVALRRRRARAHARPADPHRPLGGPLRRGARRAVAAVVQGQPARHRPRTRDPARPRDHRHAVGQARARAALHHRRRRPAPRPSRPQRRGPRPHQPSPRALEQLVDAQREGAGEGQGPLHAADPPRGRGARGRCATGASPGSAPKPGRSRCRSR